MSIRFDRIQLSLDGKGKRANDSESRLSRVRVCEKRLEGKVRLSSKTCEVVYDLRYRLDGCSAKEHRAQNTN